MRADSYIVNTAVRPSPVSPGNKKPDSGQATQNRTGRFIKPLFSISLVAIPLALIDMGASIPGTAASGGLVMPGGSELSDRKVQAVQRMEKGFANPFVSQMTAEQDRFIGEAMGGDDSCFVINDDATPAPWLDAVLADVTEDSRIPGAGDPLPPSSLSELPGEELEQKEPSKNSYKRVKRVTTGGTQDPIKTTEPLVCEELCERSEWGGSTVCTKPNIPNGVPFACNENTKNLELYDLNLTKTNFTVFRQYHRLKYLKINHCTLHRLTNNMFAGTRLETINVENNYLNTIENFAFNGTNTSGFKIFSARHNNLEQLPSDVFQPISTIRMILLGNNSISLIPTGLFANLNALDSLYLDNNTLCHIPEKAFESLTTLLNLDLSNNRLTSIDGLGYGNMGRLKKIMVAGNRLSSIPSEIFELSEIHLMDLRRNRLTGLPSSFFRSANAGDKYNTLYLEDNPWDCCEIHSKFLNSTTWVQRISATDDPVCSSPPELKGMKLASVGICLPECGKCLTGTPEVTEEPWAVTEEPEAVTEEPEAVTEEIVEDRNEL